MTYSKKKSTEKLVNSVVQEIENERVIFNPSAEINGDKINYIDGYRSKTYKQGDVTKLLKTSVSTAIKSNNLDETICTQYAMTNKDIDEIINDPLYVQACKKTYIDHEERKAKRPNAKVNYAPMFEWAGHTVESIRKAGGNIQKNIGILYKMYIKEITKEKVRKLIVEYQETKVQDYNSGASRQFKPLKITFQVIAKLLRNPPKPKQIDTWISDALVLMNNGIKKSDWKKIEKVKEILIQQESKLFENNKTLGKL